MISEQTHHDATMFLVHKKKMMEKYKIDNIILWWPSKFEETIA